MNYIKNLPPEEQEPELNRLFQNVFRTEEGQIVFTAILEDLRFFTAPTNEREEALRSYATRLLDIVVPADSHSVVVAMLNVKE